MLRKKEKLTMPENEQTENPQLVLQEVSKVYSNGKRALNQMSMVLTPGIYGLLGPNGAGKSTLMQIISGNMLQSEGSVEWCGQTLEQLGDRYRKQVGFMPQQQELLEGFDWLHLSGITPALNKNCADFILRCLREAKEMGLTVSFDGNFRSTLWSWEEARDFCTECLPYVDVLLGIEPYHLWKDETDHSKGDWKDGVPLQPSYEQQDEIFQRFIERYPNLKCIARHVRYAHSGSENSLKAFMWYEGHTFESKLYTFNILDRVGGGDAFASGLIYAMLHNYKAMDMINFAVASSAIKHTIHGDANITDDVSSIRNLMNMNYDIKR